MPQRASQTHVNWQCLYSESTKSAERTKSEITRLVLLLPREHELRPTIRIDDGMHRLHGPKNTTQNSKATEFCDASIACNICAVSRHSRATAVRSAKMIVVRGQKLHSPECVVGCVMCLCGQHTNNLEKAYACSYSTKQYVGTVLHTLWRLMALRQDRLSLSRPVGLGLSNGRPLLARRSFSRFASPNDRWKQSDGETLLIVAQEGGGCHGCASKYRITPAAKYICVVWQYRITLWRIYRWLSFVLVDEVGTSPVHQRPPVGGYCNPPPPPLPLPVAQRPPYPTTPPSLVRWRLLPAPPPPREISLSHVRFTIVLVWAHRQEQTGIGAARHTFK